MILKGPGAQVRSNFSGGVAISLDEVMWPVAISRQVKSSP
jgi:hypothetical protein